MIISMVIFLPSADSRRVVVSFYKVLVNRLVKLAQEKKVPLKTGFTVFKYVYGMLQYCQYVLRDSFVSQIHIVFQTKHFQFFFRDTMFHQSDKQFGSRSGPTFCQA